MGFCLLILYWWDCCDAVVLLCIAADLLLHAGSVLVGMLY